MPLLFAESMIFFVDTTVLTVLYMIVQLVQITEINKTGEHMKWDHELNRKEEVYV